MGILSGRLMVEANNLYHVDVLAFISYHVNNICAFILLNLIKSTAKFLIILKIILQIIGDK